jgi:hypothetical protein
VHKTFKLYAQLSGSFMHKTFELYAQTSGSFVHKLLKICAQNLTTYFTTKKKRTLLYLSKKSAKLNMRF